MAHQASSHIIDAVDAAAAAMSQIESQVGELDGPALDEMSERFVSSLSVRSAHLSVHCQPIDLSPWPDPTIRQRT
eukprot:scaffold5060_cov123-Isochrysis_galbana.AAC.10